MKKMLRLSKSQLIDIIFESEASVISDDPGMPEDFGINKNSEKDKLLDAYGIWNYGKKTWKEMKKLDIHKIGVTLLNPLTGRVVYQHKIDRYTAIGDFIQEAIPEKYPTGSFIIYMNWHI